jgi:hypothetical protein
MLSVQEFAEESHGGFSIQEYKEQRDGGSGGKVETGLSQDAKTGAKRGAWGPVKAKRRSTRIRNDGRTSLEKAQDQKKREDLEEACNAGKKRVRNSNSHKFLNIASYVGIDLGEDKEKVEENVNTCMEFDKKRGNKRTPTIEGGGVAVECEMNNKKMGNRKEKEDDEENSADDKKGSLIPPHTDRQGKHPRKKVANEGDFLEY